MNVFAFDGADGPGMNGFAFGGTGDGLVRLLLSCLVLFWCCDAHGLVKG